MIKPMPVKKAFYNKAWKRRTINWYYKYQINI